LDKYGVGHDKYCYPNSDVLINKLNIQDTDELDKAERDFTLHAVTNIEYQDPPYDFEYLRSIHEQLFSLVYTWAGELREVDISKGDTRFCNMNRIEAESNKIFDMLHAQNYFEGLSKEELVNAMAELYADLNMIHPFREGNGRSQRIFFDHLALHNNYIIDWEIVTKEAWLKANIHGVFCDFTPMVQVLTEAIRKID
jgi:cell filamentation protein